MRLMFPVLASIASQSVVFPAEAWPNTARLRMSLSLWSFIFSEVIELVCEMRAP